MRPGLEGHQALRLPEGKRAEQGAAYYTPDRSIGPDGDGYGGDGDSGKAGPAAETAQDMENGRRNGRHGGSRGMIPLDTPGGQSAGNEMVDALMNGRPPV